MDINLNIAKDIEPNSNAHMYTCIFMHAWSLQSCPTLCNPMDYSLSGSSVHEILQARVLEWVAISFTRGSSPLEIETGSPALQVDSEPPGNPVPHPNVTFSSVQWLSRVQLFETP